MPTDTAGEFPCRCARRRRRRLYVISVSRVTKRSGSPSAGKVDDRNSVVVGTTRDNGLLAGSACRRGESYIEDARRRGTQLLAIAASSAETRNPESGVVYDRLQI